MSAADVLVVGAGPAGAVAALVLARAGVRVRMLDRACFPRHKLCGDTLNPGSMAILEALDASLLARRVRDRAHPIVGMTVTGPDRACVTADYPLDLRGASMTRAALDLLLVEAAVDAGVRFDHGISVRTPLLDEGSRRVGGVQAAWARGGEAIPARVVIAADGRASRLAASMALSSFAPSPRRWAFGAYFTDVAGMTGRGEMHVRADGYIGVAPLPRGVANVCVVRERRLCARQSDGARVVADAVASDPILRERFAGARQISEVSVLGPLAVRSRGAGCHGLLLAGDAAGFVDPMTGDGLRFALRGGMLAAQAAMRELETGAPAFRALDAARHREFAGKWRVNRALRALVGSPRAVRVAALVTSHWNAPVRSLIGIAGDVHLALDGAPDDGPHLRGLPIR